MGRRNDKVTCAVLREMAMGETRTFELPGANAIDCGKTMAYRLQYSLHCKFSAVSDYTNNRLTITKNPRP